MLPTRDAGVARRMGLSPGMVREVARLAGLAGGSRTAPMGVPGGNPWLSQSASVPGVRESYASSLGRLMDHSSRSSPVKWSGTDIAQAIAGAVALAMGGGPLGRALALRELLEQTTGLTGVMGQGSPAFQEGGLVVPAGWTVFRNCPQGANAWYQFPPTVGTCTDFPYLSLSPNNAQLQTFQLLQTNLTYAASFDQYFATPYWRWGWRLAYRWTGPNLSGAAAYAQRIRMGSPAAMGMGISPVGMAQPLFGLRRLTDEMKVLMLPNMALPSVHPHPARVQAAQAAREALGLREHVEPATPLLPRPKPVDNWPEQLMPGIRAETSGSRWRLGAAHQYVPDHYTAKKTKKLKIGGVAWRVFSKVMSMFTESNDAIESIWKAMPQRDRHAGLTSTGNRRTDSMIRDLYNGWDRIDWDQAIANLVANEVEDRLIGETQRTLNRATPNSGQGLGTQQQRWMEGVDGGVTDWVESITGRIESDGPAAIRRVREAITRGSF